MITITQSTKPLATAPAPYTRVVLIDTTKDWHRFVETKEGVSEYHIGIGKSEELSHRHFITLIRSIVRSAKQHQVEKLCLALRFDDFPKLARFGEEWFYSTLAENIHLAAYEFTAYKTTNAKKKELVEVLLADLPARAKTAIARGELIGTYANIARDIANTPGDDLTPAALAKKAVALSKGTKVDVTVFDEKRIKKEGLHALWAVGKGADDMPRFIIMEYWGLKRPHGKEAKLAKYQPILLCGKGITYDTGGLNVKPSGSMHDMHLDMSGGAAVIASIIAAARLGVRKNIIALIPTAENAISEKSMRAGDIIKSHAGKTIEVLHTDAEGRLVLADALSYGKRYHPRVALDVATLTGAAIIALGQHASAVMTEDDALRSALQELGEASGDYVWPLPLWDEYKSILKQTRADVANIHPNFSKYGGAIEGAAFLSFFAPPCPWAHIDIAPRMDSIASDKLAKGSTGEPVRLLIKFLETY